MKNKKKLSYVRRLFKLTSNVKLAFFLSSLHSLISNKLACGVKFYFFYEKINNYSTNTFPANEFIKIAIVDTTYGSNLILCFLRLCFL